MTGKRWSSGNTRPGSRPGAQSPAPGKGRRAAPLRRHPQGVTLGRKGRRGAQARRLGGRRPLRTPRARLCLRLSLPARGRGRRGQSGRSVLAAALLRDSLGACGQCGAFTCLLPLCFFFFFCCFALDFFMFYFFVCVDFFALPGPRRKRSRFHYNRNREAGVLLEQHRGSLAELLVGRDVGTSPAP